MGGTPIPGLDGCYALILGLDRGYPIQLMGIPPSRSGPKTGPNGGVPPSRTALGTAPIQDWIWTPPSPHWEQHNEHLLRSRRYASRIHAGGLLCCFVHWQMQTWKTAKKVFLYERKRHAACHIAALSLDLPMGVGVPLSSPDREVPLCNPVGVWTDRQPENITFPYPSDAGGNNLNGF